MTYPTLEEIEAEDRAIEAAFEVFRKLGRDHAEFAIDQQADYEDARASFFENLGDTLAEQHKGATNSQIEAAYRAYDAVWDANK